jgi:hypothetical protein
MIQLGHRASYFGVSPLSSICGLSNNYPALPVRGKIGSSFQMQWSICNFLTQAIFGCRKSSVDTRPRVCRQSPR